MSEDGFVADELVHEYKVTIKKVHERAGVKTVYVPAADRDEGGKQYVEIPSTVREETVVFQQTFSDHCDVRAVILALNGVTAIGPYDEPPGRLSPEDAMEDAHRRIRRDES